MEYKTKSGKVVELQWRFDLELELHTFKLGKVEEPKAVQVTSREIAKDYYGRKDVPLVYYVTLYADPTKSKRPAELQGDFNARRRCLPAAEFRKCHAPTKAKAWDMLMKRLNHLQLATFEAMLRVEQLRNPTSKPRKERVDEVVVTIESNPVDALKGRIEGLLNDTREGEWAVFKDLEGTVKLEKAKGMFDVGEDEQPLVMLNYAECDMGVDVLLDHCILYKSPVDDFGERLRYPFLIRKDEGVLEVYAVEQQTGYGEEANR